MGWIRRASRMVSRMVSLMLRLILAGMLFVEIAAVGFVSVKSSQPVGTMIGIGGSSAKITSLNYWQFMSDRLHASSQTPADCHHTRLIFLAIALPFYPALYTYAALFPESFLAQHIQPNPLLPGPIGLKDIPNTWWRLVVEISWLAFDHPLWNFTPAVGQRVRLDERCVLTEVGN